ncbi:formylglycine-generating enzyme family protein [Actinoplanes sp. NPDC024001]|uniref:formylglycine-generating enzyme family protein n=1 Tax=Actinoplanes sp. NPDC024001 TaxID=3154598 RepID=UPI0033E68AA6
MEPNLDLIAVPAGAITLADRRTERRWTVEVAGFRLAAIPVTQAVYAEVTGAWPSTARGGALPVEGVSWWDALHFCNALSERHGLTPAYHLLPAGPPSPPAALPAHGRVSAGGRVDTEGRLRDDGSLLPSPGEPGVLWDRAADGYRLPTEAEWEHACRAGTTGARYGALDEIAWYRGNSGERVHEAGGKLPNAWGLHDMLGNVWDWCWDTYDQEVYGTYRVLRGGGWFDEQWSCRASVRRRSHPSLRIDDVGFRIARSVVTPAA